MGILDGGIRNLFGAAFGSFYQDATLVRVTFTPDGEGGGTTTEATEAVKVQQDMVSERTRAAAGYQQDEKRFLILQSGVTGPVQTGCKLQFEGIEYLLSSPEQDPARSYWAVRAVPVGVVTEPVPDYTSGNFLLPLIEWDETKYPLDINKVSGIWRSGFDRNLYLPDSLWQAFYYVDQALGNDANPGTQALPFRSIWRASQIGEAGGVPFEAQIAPGNYSRTRGFNQSGVQFEVTQKAKYVATGPGVVVGPFVGTDETLTFAADLTFTNTHKATRSNTSAIFDLSVLDADGLPTALAYVATAALCDSTPNSWFLSGSDLYIHRADGAQPVREVNTRIILSHTNFRRNATCGDIYVEGIDFFGNGSSDGALRLEGLVNKVNIFERCRFLAAGSPRTLQLLDGVQINNSSGLFAFRDCVGIGNAKDAFNAHWSVDATRATFVLTENCRSRRNGKFGSISNNGITGHETVVWLDLYGDYEEDAGGEVNFIQDSRLAAFGTRVAFDNGDGSTRAGFITQNTAKFYLWDCEAEMDNGTIAGLQAALGSQILTRDFNMIVGTTAGAGTIGTF